MFGGPANLHVKFLIRVNYFIIRFISTYGAAHLSRSVEQRRAPKHGRLSIVVELGTEPRRATWQRAAKRSGQPRAKIRADSHGRERGSSCTRRFGSAGGLWGLFGVGPLGHLEGEGFHMSGDIVVGRSEVI